MVEEKNYYEAHRLYKSTSARGKDRSQWSDVAIYLPDFLISFVIICGSQFIASV